MGLLDGLCTWWRQQDIIKRTVPEDGRSTVQSGGDVTKDQSAREDGGGKGSSRQLLLEKEKQWDYTSLSQTHTLHHFPQSPPILPIIVAAKGSWFPFLRCFGCSTLWWILSSVYCQLWVPNCGLHIIQYWQELEDELIRFRWPNIISGVLSNPRGIFLKCHTVLKTSLLFWFFSSLFNCISKDKKEKSISHQTTDTAPFFLTF